MPIEREVAGMRCGEVLADLSLFMDGDLPEARTRQVASHLEGCDVCLRFGHAFVGAVQSLREAEQALKPPDAEVFDRLRRRLAGLIRA